MTNTTSTRYPLLDEILALKGMTSQAMYTTRDAAKIFGVSTKAIQNRIASGQFKTRDLPGRAKFLNQDFEEFLTSSRRRRA
jgi:hypothetical protein